MRFKILDSLQEKHFLILFFLQNFNRMIFKNVIFLLLLSRGRAQFYEENDVIEENYDYDGTYEPVEPIKRKRGNFRQFSERSNQFRS